MSEPVFKSVFGAAWDDLPPVMKKHYANRAYCDDVVTVEGVMKVETSRISRMLSPFFRLIGTLVPYEGENIPATVVFTSTAASDVFQFDRVFHFPGRKPYRFRSRMKPVGGNALVEFMRFGIGWHLACQWTGDKVVLSHKGYVIGLFGMLLPLPVGWVIGRGYAEEVPVNDDEFTMMMEITHPVWGRVYGYSGRFKVVA